MRISSRPHFSPFHTRFLEAATEFPEPEIDQSIVERFSASVDRFAERTAVVSDSHSLSYAKLNAIANGIACGLFEHSADSDALVGLCIDDDALLIIAAIGVLKSGKAYLVLDPRYPDERIRLLLRESETRVVIYSKGWGETTSDAMKDTDVRLLSFDGLSAAGTESGPGVTIGTDDLALVMYTSGSTGKPHGVAHTHRSILEEIREISSTMRTGYRDTWIQYAPMSFASAIRSTFGALLTGGTLVLYDIKRFGFSRLEETLRSRRVTIFRSLPSTFRHFTGILDKKTRFPDLRIVSLGGETITPTDIERFNRHSYPHCLLAVSYGPTECLGACWGFIEHDVYADGPRVPIGFARPGKSVSIVDENHGPVTDNVVGEIAVTGRHLSNGYWKNEETTRRRFRWNGDGSRTFFTGDLGVRDDGLVTHLGRKDNQTKIRGYRIDILEIEEHLRQELGVEDAVVMVRTDGRGNARLVAYVLQSGGRYPALSGVKQKLGGRLPHYMVPDLIETVTDFPLNANGKIDRDVFPNPLSWSPGAGRTDMWQTDTQRNIADIWGRVGLTAIGPDESFIHLGGDSLGAAQVANHLSKRFGVDVPIGFILDASVGDLEMAIHELRRGVDC